MATTTSATSTQRIPLHVIHSNDGEKEYSSHKTSTNNGTYDMRNMSDETDRIKIRMKEFEERCKRWREDFFSKQNSPQNTEHMPSQFTDINNNPSSISNATYNSIPTGSSSVPFASTLHKSYVEDTANGEKRYKIEFDLGDFKQNELLISTTGKTLIIKGILIKFYNLINWIKINASLFKKF